MNILIIGDARHGKDTFGDMLAEEKGLIKRSSSHFAAELFLRDRVEENFNITYQSLEDCYNDRIYFREFWYKEIQKYNEFDGARLAKALLVDSDIYTGMRDSREIEASIKQGVFDLIIGVYDYRKPRESKESNTIDVFKYSDILINNNKGLKELREKAIAFGL